MDNGDPMATHPQAAPSHISRPRNAPATRDYIQLILRIMAQHGMPQRMLANRTGISKSRLGVLLHSDSAKRATMTVGELEIILHALNINLVQAFVHIETFPSPRLAEDARHAPLITMLCDMFISLPRKLIEVLDTVDGLDGSEVRREWALPLQKAVIKRIAQEVLAVTERRARFANSDDFYL